MDEFNTNNNLNHNEDDSQNQSGQSNQPEQPTTPFQTPVRGADEQPGSGYHNAGNTYSYSYQNQENKENQTASAYQQWSGNPNPSKKKSKKKRKFPWKPVIAVIVVGALAFGGGMAAGGGLKLPNLSNQNASANNNNIGTGSGINENYTQMEINSTGDDMASYADVYQKVSPSVVAIVVDAIQMGSESSGSGVIMSEDGYVITNNHVVNGGDRFTVILADSSSYTATLVGTDEQTDLAVLKIEASGLTAADFGDSNSIQVGDRAFAIGSPGGIEYQNSFTGGFISAINRDVTINDRVMSLIQTDTAINPGNSGGALVNTTGQVIGITSSKLSSYGTTSIEGMGFAIPTATVKQIVDELIAYGHVTGRPAIGISGYDLDETRAQYFNLPQGVYVSSVDIASDAYAKGIKSGDIITGVNGKKITGMSDINAVKNDLKAGDSITLTIYRSGQTLDVTIQLIDEANLSGTTQSSNSSSSQSQDGNTNPYGGYGFGEYLFP